MEEVEVVVEALRSEAITWDENSGVVGQISSDVESLRMSRLQAGIFQIMVTAYNDAVDVVQSRCSEGTTNLADIATALRANADAYENQELEVTDSFSSLDIPPGDNRDTGY